MKPNHPSRKSRAMSWGFPKLLGFPNNHWGVPTKNGSIIFGWWNEGENPTILGGNTRKNTAVWNRSNGEPSTKKPARRKRPPCLFFYSLTWDLPRTWPPGETPVGLEGNGPRFFFLRPPKRKVFAVFLDQETWKRGRFVLWEKEVEETQVANYCDDKLQRSGKLNMTIGKNNHLKM